MPPGMMHQAILPKPLMELQLGQVDLLMAMYASDEAVSIDDASLQLLESLRSWCDSEEETPPGTLTSRMALLLTLDLSDENNGVLSGDFLLQLELSVPLVYPADDMTEDSLTEPPKVKIRLRQPSWMSKAQSARLTDGIPDDDMLSAIEYVKEAASQHISESRQADATAGLLNADECIVRIWFYFPSISTRSKRDDIVNYAPSYGLTGFLLAGKPGVLCLEGSSQAIDDYMKFIKTESWSDIPSQHKKVSERFRETRSDLRRAFKDMQEITGVFGERRGVRANRNDMKALEVWLNENGVGDAFEKLWDI